MSVLKRILEQRWPGVVTEYRFHPKRKWRFDYAWPDRKIALEIEGGTWALGRHVRGKGYENDCIKYSEAAVLGWRIIRATTTMCESGIMMGLLERAMK